MTDTTYETLAKAYAAELLFDLKSGEQNIGIAQVLSPACIYDAVQLSSSLSINVNGIGHELVPYWPFLTEDYVLEIMEDMKASIEGALKEANHS